MNKQPQFSIITICYNSSATIERTIKSVLAQTFTDYEYIIVDGGSKDSTLDIVKKYEPLFEGRMKWKSEPDKGIYDAMNKGIERSSGIIIGIVNSDDWLEADALENVYNAFVENGKNLDTIYTGGIKFHSDSGIIVLNPNLDKFRKSERKFAMAGIRHPATFIPKHVYDTNGIYDDRMKILADTDLVVRVSKAGCKFVAIDTPLSNMADGGISNQLTWKTAKISFNDKKRMLSKYKMHVFDRYYLLLLTAAIIICKRTIYRLIYRHK